MDKNKVNINSKKIQVCEHCGKEITGDEVRYFKGQVICVDCLDSHTTFCTHCGERIWRDDNEGTLSMPLCRRCYGDYYTTCNHCGRIIVPPIKYFRGLGGIISERSVEKGCYF